eukprot:COSAG02_NODE_375_length_23579_cov_148.725596_2_plen_51_part_00
MEPNRAENRSFNHNATENREKAVEGTDTKCIFPIGKPGRRLILLLAMDRE